MASKWDLVLDQKPVPIEEHLIGELAALFAKDLTTWPPPIEGESNALQGLVHLQLDHEPSPTLKREAFKLARWDLENNLQAYDEYMRNKRWLQNGLQPNDKPVLLFFSRFVMEQLLALAEHTQGKLGRQSLMQILDLTQEAVLKAGTP